MDVALKPKVQEIKNPFKACSEKVEVINKLVPDKEVPIVVFYHELAVLLSEFKVFCEFSLLAL